MAEKLRVLDLFSGIGGFSLGLEATGGFETAGFVEIEPFCREVLARHWPDVPVYDDVREINAETIGYVDVITGGFPCQDVSNMGAKWSKREGVDGSRSGLWSEFHRLIRDIRPRYAIVENVTALLSNGMGRILGDLAEIGYDAAWESISGNWIGTPHRRNRVWLVAYDPGQRVEGLPETSVSRQPCFSWVENVRGVARWPRRSDLYDAELCGSVNGISARLDTVGNAVIPQVVEIIGQAILEAERVTLAKKNPGE